MSDGGTTITGYIVTPYIGSTAQASVTAAASARTRIVPGLANGTSYTFRVAALNSVGAGDQSGPSNAVTPTAGSFACPGCAIGAYGTVQVGPPPVTLPPTPYVSVTGSSTSATVGSVSVPQTTPYLTTDELTASSTSSGATITSSASVANISLGPSGAVVSSPSVTSTCTTTPDAMSSSSTLAPGTLINGAPISGTPAPNTMIYFDGGFARLNGQFTSTNPDGSFVKSVRAISVRFYGNGGNDLIFADSQCRQLTAAPPATVPGAVTSPSATAGDSQATVAWTAPADYGGSSITGYRVTPYIGATAQATITFDSTATTQSITGLTNGTQYTFEVAAINLVGPGPSSGPSNAVTPIGVPGAPTIGAATKGNGQATVSWAAPAGDGGSPITGYVVIPYVNEVAQPSRRFDTTDTAQTINGLSNGTSYTFKVAAVNAAGDGPQSLDSNVVTPSAK